MSDFSKTRSALLRYDSDMDGEHLLLLDKPATNVAIPRFERSAAPFAIHVAPVFPELAKHVESVCVLEGRADDPARPPMLDVVPGPTSTLCITYGPEVEHAGAVAPSMVSGLYSRTRSYRPLPAIGVVIVGFKPGGLRRFIGASADELAETNVSALDLWGADVTRLEERVAGAKDNVVRTTLVQRFLIDRLVPSGWDPLAARIAHTIVEAGGDVSVRAIAADAGLSERQLERRFSAAVGLRPKRFARLARFSRVITLARAGLPWAEVAYKAGFSDQSHLSNEFLSLVGTSPDTFARRRHVSTRRAG